ncbi:hypothetical protein [Rhodohalobacter mucosus]|uniref:Uncharacterized protein n=1 Tax=Rhodohalobacter mucosus TaxID=2079485 RepID=A0A316TMQ1_9BACT|nr:hypothetical protein [Rhodohalobacter mucosus]PWN05700.1 hypothetical protein DDZ15_14030 [Rhodohalobacter mucosus]
MDKHDRDYLRDIAEIRSMMEKSSKFLSLSGWAGIMAGIYALAGTWAVYSLYGFYPDELRYSTPHLSQILLIAFGVLILALATAFWFSHSKASQNGERAWNATSRRMLSHMAAPLLSGGVLIVLLITSGFTGLAAPLTLLFYGLALYNAGNYTIPEVRIMGVVQIILGLTAVLLIGYSLLIWAAGFGLVHILYGIYMYFKYER